jgi:two-component system response regulator GlrR
MSDLSTTKPIGRRRSDLFIAASEASHTAIEQAAAAARGGHTLLINGASGCGRKHLARSVHSMSSRAASPFVVFSARGIPATLQTQELFGQRTGVLGGALAEAGDGTLVIADAEHLTDSLRGVLVQIVKEGRVSVAGESEALRPSLIVTADSRERAVLGDVEIHTITLEGLAKRPEDILPLAAHFLAVFSFEEGITPIGFTRDARRWLLEEAWTGEVRELRERLRNAVRLSGDGAVSAEALMLGTSEEEVVPFKVAKRAFETRYVEGLLRRCNGNISRAARLARKDRKDFYDVIRRTGVEPSQFRS